MANPPTDNGYLDIADLLESEELKAKEKIAQQKAEANGNANADHHMGGTSPDVAPSPANSLDLPFRPSSRHTDSGLQRRSDADRDFMSSGRYLTHREVEDERRTRRYGRCIVTDDESDKHSANGSVRSRRRSRSPRNEGRRGHRSRDRADDHYYIQRDSRGRGPRFENDSYRPGGDRDRRAGRSRSPLRPRGGRDDRDRRGRDYHGSQSDRRHSYRGGDGGNKRKTPEPTDDERDRRTVFVQQLAARLRSRELRDFFEQVGPVVDAQIVKDRVSGRSKG